MASNAADAYNWGEISPIYAHMDVNHPALVSIGREALAACLARYHEGADQTVLTLNSVGLDQSIKSLGDTFCQSAQGKEILAQATGSRVSVVAFTGRIDFDPERMTRDELDKWPTEVSNLGAIVCGCQDHATVWQNVSITIFTIWNDGKWYLPIRVWGICSSDACSLELPWVDAMIQDEHVKPVYTGQRTSMLPSQDKTVSPETSFSIIPRSVNLSRLTQDALQRGACKSRARDFGVISNKYLMVSKEVQPITKTWFTYDENTGALPLSDDSLSRDINYSNPDARVNLEAKYMTYV